MEKMTVIISFIPNIYLVKNYREATRIENVCFEDDTVH